MKTYKWLFLASAIIASGMVSSCKDEDEYEYGKAETEGCYGVYFPTQDVTSGSLIMSPTDEPKLTISVCRTNSKGAITVPVVATYSDETVFTRSDIVFEDGQSETTFDLTFPNAVEGVTYTASIAVEDPQYAMTYGSNPVTADIEFMRVQYQDFTDASGNVSTVTFTQGWWGEVHTAKIKYYEVDGVRYCETYDEALVGEGSEDGGFFGVDPDKHLTFTWNSSTNYIDLPVQDVYYSSSYSAMVQLYDNFQYYNVLTSYAGSWSDADDFYSKNSGQLQYRSYYDGNGGFYIYVVYYYMSGIGGWDVQNFDIIGLASGYTRVDYSISAAAGLTEDGVVPVTFTTGADVASVKYAVYEGTLTDSDAKSKASSIASGSETTAASLDMTTKAAGITLGATGVYTLVADAFDEAGTYQGYKTVGFTYVAAGDEEANAVVVSAGLELTSRYGGDGYTKKNSISFYVYGSELTDVKVGLYTSASLSKLTETQIDSLAGAQKSVSEDILAEINDGGYSDVYTGLSALTEYTLVVWATNGYESTVVTAAETTEGLALVPLTTGTYTYDFWWEGDDSGLTLSKDPNYANTYVISNWGGGVDFTFTYDPSTGKVNVPAQYIGSDYSTYGAVYVVEALDYFTEEKYSDYSVDSYYDASANAFNFCMGYVVSAGYFGSVVETFKLDGTVTFTSDTQSTSSVQSAVKSSSEGKSLHLDGSPSLRKVHSVGVMAGLDIDLEHAAVSFKSSAIDRPKAEFTKNIDKNIAL